MKTTEELILKVFPRLGRLREKEVDFLWNDFLGAVEKAINTLPNELLAQTECISIFYETHEGDDNIYRSNIIQADNEEIVCEKQDIIIGKKNELKNAFRDFKKKVNNDPYCKGSWMMVEELFGINGNQTIIVDFWLAKIDIIPKEENYRYKLIKEKCC